MRRTGCNVYLLMELRYRGARPCSSDFQPASGTATRKIPSLKLRARVRSATAEPQTTGQAIKGAWVGGACRSDCATILSSSDPARSTSTPSSPARSETKFDSSIPGVHCRMSSGVKFAPHELQGCLAGRHPPFQLRIFHRAQNLFEPRPWRVAFRDQI